MFFKKVVLKNFAKFTGKPPCQSLFFNKVAGLRPATLSKKRLRRSCFPMNFVKFLRTPFYKEYLWRQLLLILVCHEQEFMNLLQMNDLQDKIFCLSLIGETVSKLISNNPQKNNVQSDRFFLTKLYWISPDWYFHREMLHLQFKLFKLLYFYGIQLEPIILQSQRTGGLLSSKIFSKIKLAEGDWNKRRESEGLLFPFSLTWCKCKWS